jgi:hypothetical protein
MDCSDTGNAAAHSYATAVHTSCGGKVAAALMEPAGPKAAARCLGSGVAITSGSTGGSVADSTSGSTSGSTVGCPSASTSASGSGSARGAFTASTRGVSTASTRGVSTASTSASTNFSASTRGVAAARGTKQQHSLVSQTATASSSQQRTNDVVQDDSRAAEATDDRQCSQCGGQHEELLVCSGCMGAKYCSRDCQKAHWREHRGECRRVQREQQAAAESCVK